MLWSCYEGPHQWAAAVSSMRKNSVTKSLTRGRPEFSRMAALPWAKATTFRPFTCSSRWGLRPPSIVCWSALPGAAFFFPLEKFFKHIDFFWFLPEWRDVRSSTASAWAKRWNDCIKCQPFWCGRGRTVGACSAAECFDSSKQKKAKIA